MPTGYLAKRALNERVYLYNSRSGHGMDQHDQTPKDTTALLALIAIGNRLGFIYGSEDISMLLYTMVRREQPLNIVELGTGLGVSALWMAQALKENGRGRITTFDDGSHWKDTQEVRRAAQLLAKAEPFDGLDADDTDYPGFINRLSERLDLRDYLTFIPEHIDLAKESDLAARDYEFMARPVDLVFADIQRSPDDMLDVISFFLHLHRFRLDQPDRLPLPGKARGPAQRRQGPAALHGGQDTAGAPPNARPDRAAPLHACPSRREEAPGSELHRLDQDRASGLCAPSHDPHEDVRSPRKPLSLTGSKAPWVFSDRHPYPRQGLR
jgi:hypothetical protein